MKHYDVLVAGAGPTGCATAITTARAGLSTVLLDRARPARTWAGESLPPGMGKLMRSVFGPDILSDSHHQPAVGTRSAWGSAELVETDFLTNPLGEGWLLDRQYFDGTARKAAIAAGVAIARVRHLGPLSRGPSAWYLDIGDGTCLSTQFLVDATGRSGALLRQLRVSRVASNRQIAILATYSDDGDKYCGTTVEAAPEGWWYSTPLPDGRRVLAYLTDEDLWRRSTRNWHGLLNQTLHVKRCAGQNAMSAGTRAYPAGTAHAGQVSGENWLAVGDAAASFDPLSSQGLASAVLMGARAGAAVAHQSDRIGAIEAWAETYSMLVAEHADLSLHYARMEGRWPNSVFWRRRQQPDDSVRKPRWIRDLQEA